MSANNCILINRKTFEVFHKDMDENVVYEQAKGNNLEEAVDIAQRIISENEIVEYGVWFTEK